MPAWMPALLGSASFVLVLAIIAWSVLRRHRSVAEGPLMLRGPDGRVVGVPARPALSPEAEAALRRTVRPAKDLRRESLGAMHDASGVLGWPAWLVSFQGSDDVTWSHLILEYESACPYAFTAVLSWGFKPAKGFRRARFLDGRVRGKWFQWDGYARDWPETRPEIGAGVGALMRELAGSIGTRCDGVEYAPGLLCISFTLGAEFKDPDLADPLAAFIEASERLWLLDEATAEAPTLDNRESG